MDVAGAVASILQIIDIGVKVGTRINEYSRNTTKLPEAFRSIQRQLPIFLDILRMTKTALKARLLTDDDGKVLGPVISEALQQSKDLEKLIARILPAQGDSDIKRKWKGVVSLKYDSDVTNAGETIKGYIQTLTNHGIASDRLRTLGMMTFRSRITLKP